MGTARYIPGWRFFNVSKTITLARRSIRSAGSASASEMLLMAH